jgi:hypothetical protein
MTHHPRPSALLVLPHGTEMPRPATTTQSYHFPSGHSFPPAPECSPAQLLEIAHTGAFAPHYLLSSASHVAAVCQLVVSRLVPEIQELRGQLAAAQGQARIDQAAVDRARNEHQVTALELEAILAEHKELQEQFTWLRVISAQVSSENVRLRHRNAGTVPAAERAPRSLTCVDGSPDRAFDQEDPP